MIGILPGSFFRGANSTVMQIFPLFLDQIFWGRGGKLPSLCGGKPEGDCTNKETVFVTKQTREGGVSSRLFLDKVWVTRGTEGLS